MTTWLIAGIAVHYLAVFLPSLFLIPQIGYGGYLGSRDDEPPAEGMYGRARRILRNSNENLAAFVGLGCAALALNAFTGEAVVLPVGSAGDVDMELATFGAMVFVIARALFIPLYLFAVPLIRSGAWIAGFAGLLMMAYALI
ncbi:MAG: MAPEG family protein [Pseudomonadota bacterium]